jgi:alcohol dehydrogenase
MTTLCPGGRERMRRLIAFVAGKRVKPQDLITHRFALNDIENADALLSEEPGNGLKMAIKP